MKRRIFLIALVVSLLLLSSFISVGARNLALTATMSATPSPIPFAEANFVGTPLSGTTPLTVQFTHLYTATGSPILGCGWTFGDGTNQFVSGSFSTCPSVSHVYTASGNFTVQLSVQITDMIFNVIKTNYIQVAGGPTPTPSCDNPTYTGHVKDVTTGQGISGATVAASLDVPRTFSATADVNGLYSLTIPTGYGCHVTGLTASASGYNSLSKGASLVNPNDFSLTKSGTPTAVGQPDLSYPAAPLWIWDPNAYDSVNACYHYTPVLVWNVQVKNAGSADAGSFVVSQNYDRQQTVSGLPAGQTSTLYFPFPGQPIATAAAGQPTLSAFYSNFSADYNNQVSESNETNNTTRSAIPVFTPTLQSSATRVFCKTPTPGTPVATFTPTRTPTRTNTPGITNTPTRTNTPTMVVGVCSPVTSTITAPFTFDGAGTFCWQSSNLGAYINSWNTASVTINGVNITNVYVPASSYPAKIGGFWYVGYNSSVAWGHLEAK